MAASESVTMEMSPVPLFEGSPLSVWSNAIALPSGDQSKPPTVKFPFVRRFVFFDSTSITQRCERRWSPSTNSNSPYFLSRSFHDSGFGSVIVKAICLPSGDQAIEPTPSSSRVSCSASPNDGRMSQICCLSDLSDVNAMRDPSGAQRGEPLDFLPLVSWRFVPVATSAIQISVS